MSTPHPALVLATTSTHKVREITDLLQDNPHFEIISLRDFPDLEAPVEDGLTMRDNARLKAEYYARATGLPALADDSGIEVDALDGAPGVLSARWIAGSDADRTQALLDRLRDVAPAHRTARYRCAICVASPDGSSIEAEATCEGRIAAAPRGDNGFGYDPIFEITAATGAPSEWIGKTMAEAPSFVKAQVSHRARALAVVKSRLGQLD
ncbi:MAG TPA: non-canonical purine NTP pyrophosphatase [Abditibacteriaceae bacterium]|nr:non-canonical purine NTP pyrophosphatase [Abditibacteriaceae bacterium]